MVTMEKNQIKQMKLYNGEIWLSLDNDELLNIHRNKKGMQLNNTIKDFTIHPSNRYIGTTPYDNIEDFDYYFNLIDFNTNQSIYSIKNDDYNNNKQTHSLDFHPDGMLMGITNGSNNISIYDLTSKQLGLNMNLETSCNQFIFSENGYHIAMNDEKNVYIYDLRKATQAIHIQYYENPINNIYIDPSGTLLMTATNDTIDIKTMKKAVIYKTIQTDTPQKIIGYDIKDRQLYTLEAQDQKPQLQIYQI